jgi:hypothetical protein
MALPVSSEVHRLAALHCKRGNEAHLIAIRDASFRHDDSCTWAEQIRASNVVVADFGAAQAAEVFFGLIGASAVRRVSLFALRGWLGTRPKTRRVPSLDGALFRKTPALNVAYTARLYSVSHTETRRDHRDPASDGGRTHTRFVEGCNIHQNARRGGTIFNLDLFKHRPQLPTMGMDMPSSRRIKTKVCAIIPRISPHYSPLRVGRPQILR